MNYFGLFLKINPSSNKNKSWFLRQNKNLWNQGLDFTIINVLYNPLLIISSLFIFYILFSETGTLVLKGKAKLTVILLLAFTVLNAFVTASLANVYDRLQGRVSWLIVFCAVMILVSGWKILFTKIKSSLVE